MTQLHINPETGERLFIDVSRPMHVPYSSVVRALLMIPVAVYMAAVVIAFASGTSIGVILLVTSAIFVIVGYTIGTEIRTANRIDNAVSRVAFRLDGHRTHSEIEYGTLYGKMDKLTEIMLVHADDTGLRMIDAASKADERATALYDALRVSQADLWERLGPELLAINGGQAALTAAWRSYLDAMRSFPGETMSSRQLRINALADAVDSTDRGDRAEFEGRPIGSYWAGMSGGRLSRRHDNSEDGADTDGIKTPSPS